MLNDNAIHERYELHKTILTLDELRHAACKVKVLLLNRADVDAEYNYTWISFTYSTHEEIHMHYNTLSARPPTYHRPLQVLQCRFSRCMVPIEDAVCEFNSSIDSDLESGTRRGLSR